MKNKQNKERSYIGFCFGYDKNICADCPSKKECLEQRDRERVNYDINSEVNRAS